MSARVVAEARGWIGTPYLHGASVQGAGCDCLGLLRGVWRVVEGAEPVVVPRYSADWDEPQRRVAPGQSVVLYDGDQVVGAGTAR